MDLRRRHPASLSPRALAIAGWSAFLLAGLLFLAIGWNVTARGSLVALDARVSDWLQEHGHPALIAFLLAVTHLNSTAAIAAWSLVFGAVLARLREWYWILTLALAVGGAMLLNLVLKGVYERARPRFAEPILELATYSFPSGHTTAATAFYGVLAAFLVSRFYDARRRAACVAGAIGAIALVAFSRVYLGAHYLSDVVAAACSATAWLVLCLATGHALVRKRLRPTWMLAGTALLVALAAAALLPLEDWSLEFTDWVSGLDFLTALMVFVAVASVAALLLVPAVFYAVPAGAVFGFGWGLVVTVAAALASASIAFLLARHVLRRHVERAATRSKTFKQVEAAVKRDAWKVVALLRLSPVGPSGAKSYFLGLMRVSFADYLTATAAGMLPALALKVYIGAAGRGALTEGGALNWSILALGVLASFGLAWLLGRRLRTRLELRG